MNELREKESKIVWISWVIWVVVIILMPHFIGTESSVSMELSSDGLYMENDTGISFDLKWGNICILEVREDFEYGAMLEGTDNSEEKNGKWINEEFGEYMLFVNTEIRNCIVCTMKNGETVVFNFESAESTISLYEAILKKL